MQVLRVKRKQAMKVVIEEHRTWCGKSIESLDFEKLAKYLGVRIRHDGNIVLPRSDWEQQLERLKKAHLTPAQKSSSHKRDCVWKNNFPTKTIGPQIRSSQKIG